MKDGVTHLAHKAEHAVDLTSGALLALTLQPADEGDTATIQQTLEEVQAAAREINAQAVEEVVADKGYHSGGRVDGSACPAGSQLHLRTGARTAEMAG